MRNSVGYLSRQWIFVICFTCHALPADCGQPVRETRTQVREFDIFVDGSCAGTSSLKISEFNDGRTVIATEADVKISYIVYAYKYQFRGSETWRDGKFLRLESQSADGGKRSSVVSEATKAGSRCSINGGAFAKMPTVSLTTNFWYWPESLEKQPAFTLLESDIGGGLDVACRLVGTEQLQVGDQAVTCRHYQLTGGNTIDLWFDEASRFVCKKCVEDGHPTEVRLTRVRDIAPKAVRPVRR
jgi:hypothetical protein